MQKVIERLKLIGRETLNFLTNILVPLWAAVMIIAECFCLPPNVLAKMKQIEYVLFKLSATKMQIEEELDKD